MGGGGGGVLPMGKGQEFVLDRKNIHCLQRYTYKNYSRIPIRNCATKTGGVKYFKILNHKNQRTKKKQKQKTIGPT